MEEITSQKTESIEKPELLDYHNIVYWSSSLRELQGVKEGPAIQKKALIFLKLGCVEYNKEQKYFMVNHIEGYNKTNYRVWGEGKHFTCDCQFFNKVSKNWDHPRCSHIQAVLFYLEQKRWNNK